MKPIELTEDMLDYIAVGVASAVVNAFDAHTNKAATDDCPVARARFVESMSGATKQFILDSVKEFTGKKAKQNEHSRNQNQD